MGADDGFPWVGFSVSARAVLMQASSWKSLSRRGGLSWKKKHGVHCTTGRPTTRDSPRTRPAAGRRLHPIQPAEDLCAQHRSYTPAPACRGAGGCWCHGCETQSAFLSGTLGFLCMHLCPHSAPRREGAQFPGLAGSLS